MYSQRLRLLALAALLLPMAWSTSAGAQALATERVEEAPERRAPTTVEAETAREAPPFGANLFTGGFRAEREDGLNPEYIVQPGDEIAIRIWGAMTFDGIAVVDAQGNIFIPDVGPINVEGVRNADLTSHIERAVTRVFTRNINVYTNLNGTTPVIVYVTGYVNAPGSYAGVASDSMLFFLDRAGGIDLARGSFREVRVLRSGELIATADLYRFLMDGQIPEVQFQDGDTILVDRRGDTISVRGSVRNAFTFELLPEDMTGAAVTSLARPQADASHAVITGSRPGGPVSAYLPLSQFLDLELRDGDRVVVEADRREDTILVRVEGSHLGPSRFAVPRDTTLQEVLNYIEVDPRLADTDAISLRRRSIAQRQKEALNEALRRLETTVLSATSQTDAESQIRANEAKLIRDFVERAKEVEPDGVLVVAHNDRIQDVLLQPEDIVTIPEQTETVMVSGEVAVPQAVVYRPGDIVDDYIARVGGYSNRADPQKLLLVRRSGEVIPDQRTNIRPGDEIIVLPKVPVKNLEIASTIAQVIFQLAVTTGAVLGGF